MQILTRPSVHLLSAPTFYPHPEYTLPPYSSAGEALIAHAGKGCYDTYGTEGRSIADHIGRIIDTRHGSVLEHANVSFFIAGISRACSHEIVRHRAGMAYSQRSTRYTKEDDAAIVLEPYLASLHARMPNELTIEEHEELHEHIISCQSQIIIYSRQVEKLTKLNPRNLKDVALRKWARGIARNVLPHALETRMTMTGNLRAWRNFIELRSAPDAEAEIRRLAEAIFVHLEARFPLVFHDYVREEVLGFLHFKTPYSKV